MADSSLLEIVFRVAAHTVDAPSVVELDEGAVQLLRSCLRPSLCHLRGTGSLSKQRRTPEVVSFPTSLSPDSRWAIPGA